jgi:hypothetical protein
MSFELIQGDELSFWELHQLLYGKGGRKINQCVNVMGVYIVDFHVNAFVFGILVQVAGDTRGGCLV